MTNFCRSLLSERFILLGVLGVLGPLYEIVSHQNLHALKHSAIHDPVRGGLLFFDLLIEMRIEELLLE